MELIRKHGLVLKKIRKLHFFPLQSRCKVSACASLHIFFMKLRIIYLLAVSFGFRAELHVIRKDSKYSQLSLERAQVWSRAGWSGPGLHYFWGSLALLHLWAPSSIKKVKTDVGIKNILILHIKTFSSI